MAVFCSPVEVFNVLFAWFINAESSFPSRSEFEGLKSHIEEKF